MSGANWREGLWVAGLFLLAAGCGGGSKPASVSSRHRETIDRWSVTTSNAQETTPALLWNGEVGVRIGRDGTSAGPDGKPLPLFLSSDYQKTGEEKIIPTFGVLSFEATFGGAKLDPAKGFDYRQRLDFKTGVLTTGWRQKIEGGDVSVEVQSTVHPMLPVLAQTWSIRTPPETQVQLSFPLPHGATSRPSAPNGLVMERTLRNAQGRPFVDRIELDGGWEGAFSTSEEVDRWSGRTLGSKIVRIHRTVRFTDGSTASRSESGLALVRAMPADGSSLAKAPEVFQSAEALWAKTWETDIEIDGPVEDQRAVRSFLFYLRSAVHPDGNMSVAPMGLSSEQYFGHVFWDADIWVFPALALIDPAKAAAIPKYRLRMASAARSNYAAWIQAGRPTGREAMGPLGLGQRFSGMKFPWESSRSGGETVPGPSRFQDHISGSVAFSVDQAASLGLVPAADAGALKAGVAEFYRTRVERWPDGQLTLKGTMSPDENHTGDDDLYTNLLAQWCLDGTSTPQPPPPSENGGGGAILHLPRDKTSFLTYEGDPVRSYKQAAAVLAIYPLQFPDAERQAKVMMDRFADKVSKNGPAMSDSVHALIWARLGEREKAYETWRRSWQDFTNQPLLLFSEKRKKEATYFTTGAAGCLQTVLYGFLGIRIDEKAHDGAVWSTPLKNGRVLSIKPNLPPAWKKVTLKNFQVLGKRYTLEATQTGGKVSRSRQGLG